MKDPYYKKKFLICQPIIGEINGSTMVTLELCEFLKAKGAEVKVFSYYYEDPAKKLFDNLKIKTYIFCEYPKLKTKDFDYVWIHSQTLPISIIESLNEGIGKTKFIYLHMSALDYIPDERPYLYKLEEETADKVLFISEETKEKNMPFFKKKLDYAFFRNPAPVEFSRAIQKTRKKQEKILVVSNHPPQELVEVKKILFAQGITVDFIGEKQKKYTKITPEILADYSCVISIGKTVQYCLVSGTPIYVYDIFGGPGWLNDGNYKVAQQKNFSGRGFKKKTPEKISEEIINGFSAGVDFSIKNRGRFITEFSIENNLGIILKKISKRNKKPLSSQQILALKEAQTLANAYFNLGRERNKLKKENLELKEELKKITSSKLFKTVSKIAEIYKINKK